MREDSRGRLPHSGPGVGGHFISRRVLVLHGLGNRRPPDHWEFWLAERLRSRGEQVLYPQLPDPEEPRREAWEALIAAELAMLGEGERVVVAHSLGCTAWLALCGRAAPVDRALLVAPPDAAVLAEIAPAFADPPPDAATVRRGAREVLVVGSDGDPYNPPGVEATLGRPLGLETVVVPGAVHFRPDDGYGPWPAAEAWCLGDASALRGLSRERQPRRASRAPGGPPAAGPPA